MSREKYKIGRISELMGITPEALRYYEREGIIAPKKSTTTGYRLYDAWDVHILIRARAYRRYGLSLEETVRALDSLEPSKILSLLDEKERKLEQELQERRLLLDQLRHDEAVLRDALANIGKFRVEMSPAMHFIDVQRSYDIIDERVELYRAWIDRIPYTASGGIFEVLHDKRLRYGLVVEDHNLSSLGEEHVLETIPIPSRKCLTTFFRSGSARELCADMFQSTFEFMEKRGLELRGDPFARAVLMTRAEDGTYHSLYQGWVPFEGDLEYCSPPPSMHKAKPEDPSRR